MLSPVSASQGPALRSPLAVMQVKPLTKDMLCAVYWSSCEPRAAIGHGGKKRGAFQLNAPFICQLTCLIIVETTHRCQSVNEVAKATDVTGRHQTCVSVPSRFVEVKKLIDLAPRERQQNNNTKSQIAVVERWRIEKSNESQSGYFR